ncbi:MAG TPA: hypothetical protein VJP76_04755 [Candidatus Tumulicola sp.]|nr:hypothetical protein [Candidatus Tumulicola sp.]
MVRAAVSVANGPAERAMRVQILEVLEDLCRDKTLHDVREWYFDSLHDPVSGLGASALD